MGSGVTSESISGHFGVTLGLGPWESLLSHFWVTSILSGFLSVDLREHADFTTVAPPENLLKGLCEQIRLGNSEANAKLQVIKCLLEGKASVNALDSCGRTPVQLARELDFTECLGLLSQ